MVQHETVFETFLTQQVVQGLASPKERPRSRKVCTNRVYCTARVGIPGCRSPKLLPSGGERFKTFKVRGGGGNVGCSGGKLTREEGGDDPSGGISRRRGRNSGTLGCFQGLRLIGGGGGGAGCMGVAGRKNCRMLGRTERGGAEAEESGGRVTGREGKRKPCLL